jgi:hypothetical protein
MMDRTTQYQYYGNCVLEYSIVHLKSILNAIRLYLSAKIAAYWKKVRSTGLGPLITGAGNKTRQYLARDRVISVTITATVGHPNPSSVGWLDNWAGAGSSARPRAQMLHTRSCLRCGLKDEKNTLEARSPTYNRRRQHWINTTIYTRQKVSSLSSCKHARLVWETSSLELRNLDMTHHNVSVEEPERPLLTSRFSVLSFTICAETY